RVSGFALAMIYVLHIFMEIVYHRNEYESIYLIYVSLEFFRCGSRRLPEEFFRIKKLFLTQKLPGRCASPASGSGQLFWLFFIKQSF
ncbi:hypothetical protein DW074_17250, partial [Ruminococcus sp. AF46-10NS]